MKREAEQTEVAAGEAYAREDHEDADRNRIRAEEMRAKVRILASAEAAVQVQLGETRKEHASARLREGVEVRGSLRAERARHASKVDDLLDQLAAALEGLREADRDLKACESSYGLRQSKEIQGDLAGAVQWKFHALFPGAFPQPHPHRQRPLAEILSA